MFYNIDPLQTFASLVMFFLPTHADDDDDVAVTNGIKERVEDLHPYKHLLARHRHDGTTVHLIYFYQVSISSTFFVPKCIA